MFPFNTCRYTSGIFTHVDCTLEEAQDNKMATICRKLRLKPGMRMLDIGCGWGTLAGYAYREIGAKSVGVTLSDEGAAWARSHNPGPEFIISDYRDCPEDPDSKFQVGARAPDGRYIPRSSDAQLAAAPPRDLTEPSDPSLVH